MSLRLQILIALLAGIVLAGRAGDLNPHEIKAAFKLYNAKCAKCHKFHDPAGYSASEWQDWMFKMSRKSKLKPAQEQLLTRYLEAFRKPVRGDGPALLRPK